MNDWIKTCIGIFVGSLISVSIIIGFNITSIPLSFIIGILSGSSCTATALLLL